METAETRITIGMLDEGQEEGLRRLAQLDSGDIPAGPLLGASLNGDLVAAVSLSSGELIADPFTRTAELRALLGEHAARLNGTRPPRRGRLGFLRRRSSRAALPASPPGAGGRLVTLEP